jgi:putative NADH-flavin reductase
MRLTIFGATGGTGTCLAEQALAAGHDVTAVVRDPARLAVRPSEPGADVRLRVITADPMDPAAIIQAVSGSDAVLTAIGPRGTGVTTVSQDSVRSIIAAMQKAGARRLLTVSGSIAADEGESPYLRYLIKPVARRTFLRHVCADMRAAEAEVEASDLDWTIMRPPGLTSKPASGHYRLRIDGGLPRCLTVTRADLAACMLSAVGEPATLRKHVTIAN